MVKGFEFLRLIQFAIELLNCIAIEQCLMFISKLRSYLRYNVKSKWLLDLDNGDIAKELQYMQ